MKKKLLGYKHECHKLFDISLYPIITLKLTHKLFDTSLYPNITLKLIILLFYNIKIINFNVRVDRIIMKDSKHNSSPNFLKIYCTKTTFYNPFRSDFEELLLANSPAKF